MSYQISHLLSQTDCSKAWPWSPCSKTKFCVRDSYPYQTEENGKCYCPGFPRMNSGTQFTANNCKTVHVIMYIRDRPKLFWNNFRFLSSSYFHSTGPNESTRTKSFKKFDIKVGQNQSRSSEKYNFDTVKVWNWNFCQAIMIVF